MSYPRGLLCLVTTSNSDLAPRPPLPELEVAVREAWSRATSAEPDGWSPANPAWGQCAVTALLVQDLFGGRLLRCEVGNSSHYFNELPNGNRLDLTRSQFPEAASMTKPEPRTRKYVLSFPATRRRYGLLRHMVISALFEIRHEFVGHSER